MTVDQAAVTWARRPAPGAPRPCRADHWQRCRSILATLDQVSVITLTMRLIEALHRERVSGERGARARQSNYVDYGRWASHTMSGATRPSGLPGRHRNGRVRGRDEGGRKAALSDIDTMAGEIVSPVPDRRPKRCGPSRSRSRPICSSARTGPGRPPTAGRPPICSVIWKPASPILSPTTSTTTPISSRRTRAIRHKGPDDPMLQAYAARVRSRDGRGRRASKAPCWRSRTISPSAHRRHVRG